MRTLVLTGPGGAGVSTLAAAAAVRAAGAGRSTLLLSRQPVPVAGLADVPGLQVRTVDAGTAVERFWAGTVAPAAGALPQLALPPASSVTPLPGAAELALFAELGRASADLVVVDAGSPADAAALLALPATLRWWLDRLLPPGARALGAIRSAAVTSGAARRGPVDAALALLPQLEELLAVDRLADVAGTAVALAAVPRPGTAAALRGTATALGLHGLRPGIVLARVLPDDGTGEWWRARRAEQDAELDALAELAPVHRVPETASSPADAAAATALLGDLPLPGGGLPGAGLPAPATERLDGGWELGVPLPFAERGAVGLTRWEDDLVVTAAGARRSLRLDPLLRRCEVTGGRITDAGSADARLVVSFRPDPQLWPADLLAAVRRTP
ncbi:ion transporter [Blastococcus sp. TML/M2B]|uniref:ArsA family ATPase n=1 Tax=unclassified Blastococcus TaxID=2619396 RepID=UPI001909D5E8|nr:MULTISPECIES: ArsA-related P-loop ATPase [unclassified Blastococcus]MBN1092359.1 ion transporter [Blastococcus sp. TML/M2B]MBN1097548.1 ion transporter [Blastococcus sp. TML/C7B]